MMEISRDQLRIFTVIVGGLVLASYVWGVSRLSQPSDLWEELLEIYNDLVSFSCSVGSIGYHLLVDRSIPNGCR